MSQVINTNSLSLTAQNNLNRSQSALSSAIERLSSGLRINSAKDDAAGQAIANRFSANIRGLTQAARNANDGISIAQTTEGALNEINNNIQRIRELTVQAENGTNSKSDLQSIQAEINQRRDEIDRVAEQTQFNGVRVLANGKLTIQVGANDGEKIDVELKDLSTKSLGLDKLNVVDKSNRLSGELKTIQQGDETTVSFAADAAAAAKKTAVALVKYQAADGSYAYAVKDDSTTPAYYAITAISATGAVSFDSSAAGATVTAAVTADAGRVEYAADAKFTRENHFTLADGETLYALTDAEGKNTDNYVVKRADGKFYNATITAPAGASAQATVTVAAGAAAENKNAYQALNSVDGSLAEVDAMRSTLGAIQNRLTSAITNLNNTVNNLSAARSRIEDSDYATEVSNMTRAQILQQAGTAVLSQANQVPQNVLSLLR